MYNVHASSTKIFCDRKMFDEKNLTKKNFNESLTKKHGENKF